MRSAGSARQSVVTSAHQDETDKFRWLVETWRDDLEVYGTLGEPGFHVVAVYRFGVWSLRQRGMVRWITSKAYVLVHFFIRNFYGVELPRRAQVGKRLRLPHPMGVVIHAQAQIGDECLIRQNVTIGQYNYGRDRPPPFAPRIGNGVWVGAGAVIVGGITIGDNARIGPNTVVMTDVPPGGFVFARGAAVTAPLQWGDETGSEDRIATGLGNSIEETAPPESEAISNGVETAQLIALINEVADLGEPIDSDTPLISTGIIDSFDVVALLTAVEDRFGVTIDPEEVDVETFDTPSQMGARIASRRG